MSASADRQVRASGTQDSSPELVKGLGLTSATTLVIGSMIGSGIFIVSAEIARETDSPALLIGAWLVTGFLTIVGALSYGELAAMMPQAGGQYVFLRESLGPLWGFLYGWSMFAVKSVTGTSADVGSSGSYPAIAPSIRPASRAVRVNGLAWSRLTAFGYQPVGSRPSTQAYVGSRQLKTEPVEYPFRRSSGPATS